MSKYKSSLPIWAMILSCVIFVGGIVLSYYTYTTAIWITFVVLGVLLICGSAVVFNEIRVYDNCIKVVIIGITVATIYYSEMTEIQTSSNIIKGELCLSYNRNEKEKIMYLSPIELDNFEALIKSAIDENNN